jgi:NAD(P)H-dependent flavin oxidoreductase YrpB (nitropropane dioxygenase family)
MRTPICNQLGIEFPILAFTHCRDVAAAVSKAGGLGVLGIAGTTPETIDVELDWIENEIGDRPYGVDVLIPAKAADVGGSGKSIAELLPQEHREFVANLLDRYGVAPIPEDELDPRYARASRGGDIKENAVHLIELAVSRPQIKLAASALGPPPPQMVDLAHEHDVLVAALVGRREHAERQRDAGADIIVAQGYEAGGHVGEIGTMVLVPEIVDAVAPLPVLAAGGIANGRQVAAALALGAQGVWTGSVWLTTEEAETHPVVKQKFLSAGSSDTVRSRASTGKPARQLRSAWTDEWADPTNPDPLPMPLHGVLIAEAQQRISRSAHVPGSGAEQLVNYFVGQVVGSLTTVKPAQRVLIDMVEEYIDVAEHFAASLADAG